MEGIKWVLAGYDESAVEQALLIKESIPGSHVRALSFGPAPRTEEVLRATLALGADFAAWVEWPAGVQLEPVSIAQVLARTIKKYPYDLILAGKQSGDEESGIVGPAVAEALGIPDYGFVVDLRVAEGGSGLKFQRAVEGGAETVEAGLPVVITLQQAWNDPRTAKLPNILKSRKMPIERVSFAEVSAGILSPRVKPVSFRLPPPRTGARMIDYKSPTEAAEKLVRALRDDAKVLP